MQAHACTIEASAPQVYMTAFSQVPANTLLHKMYQKLVPDHANVCHNLNNDWPPLITTLVAHSHVMAVTFSPDVATLASGTAKETMLWDIHTGGFKKALKGHSSGVLSVAFSPDGTTLATGSVDKTIILWDVHTGELKGILKGHSGMARSVVISPNGATLASGCSCWRAQENTQRPLWCGKVSSIFP